MQSQPLMRETRRPPIPSPSDTPTDPATAAQAVGLRYVSDADPGLHRRRVGTGFRYLDVEGRPIRDPETVRRIRALAIPPAWSDVWICPSPRGHIQATGRDEKRRKQYRYHPRWRAVRDETKFGRMIAFGRALGPLRAQVETDLAVAGLPRRKVLAAVVRLLEATLIRVGNPEYARTNHSFGLTTLRDRHVVIAGGTLRFSFRGKSGVRHAVALDDPRLARVVRRCRDLPGQELFQYLDDAGQPRSVSSDDVNAYLREVTGADFTAKDFRTWAGTVLASQALQEVPEFVSPAQAKTNLVRAIEAVARRLGNTPTICRRSYVHPAVIAAYLEGTLRITPPRRTGRKRIGSIPALQREEAFVLALLEASRGEFEGTR